jgi:hydrogenase maturation protein HypF
MTVFALVSGVVQGVGYRPFVARVARETGVTGTVCNVGGEVEISAGGTDAAVEAFLFRLRSEQPPGANVLHIEERRMPERAFDGFRIIPSGRNDGQEESPVFPPDLPMCGDCLRELRDPENRRYRYPFISCASCGPRYSILEDLPYDRETTSMKEFELCGACAEEYAEGRRRHAQTISCHDCGPRLLLRTPEGECEGEAALQKGIGLLKNGGVLAVKGVGGYQFACLPTNASAVERLRLLKGREKKPFAVLFPSLTSIRAVCAAGREERELLASPARPIVLLEKRQDPFCPGVSGESRFLGAFLPCTGLHQLLTDACGPLVMTSGNLTNTPIVTEDGPMLRLSSPHLAGVLYNARRIVTPLDDSVAQIVLEKPRVIRRSRGYVPMPVFLDRRAKSPVFAAGGDLKSCFCLLRGGRAYPSQYFGDMEDGDVFRNYRENLKRMERLFRIEPERIACDLHPGYLTSALAEKLAEKGGKRLTRVQHHHAHVASVMAENGLSSCIGVAFDGTGYGTDGAVWGGEFLLCRGASFERKAHFSYVPICGGDEASRNAELAADCYRAAAGFERGGGNFGLVRAALENRVNTAESSSAGRLFDAVCAELGFGSRNTFEGECAIALENAAAAAKAAGTPPFPLHPSASERDGVILLDQLDLFRQVAAAARDGADRGAVALGFHEALADAVRDVCAAVREETGENRAALSGGVFANLLLLTGCAERLRAAGFEVFLNRAVPSNDGGLSLGQAWLCMEEDQA